MNLVIPKPHLKPQHVKHSAALTIVGGTVLEALHMFYPTGLVMLGIGGIIAVYEPYFVHEVREVFMASDE